MRRTVQDEYKKFIKEERKDLRKAGFSAAESHNAPLQNLGPENYWTTRSSKVQTG